MAERACRNRGTFYYHFKSMDALVERALFGGKRELSSDSCFMVQFMLSGVMSYLLAVGHVAANREADASASAGTAPMRPCGSFARALATIASDRLREADPDDQ